MISLSVQGPKSFLPVCPTVGIWQGRLPTIPTGVGWMAWFSPPAPVVPSKFYVREGFPRTTDNFEFPKSRHAAARHPEPMKMAAQA